MLEAKTWDELLKLAGCRQVRYVGHTDGAPVYEGMLTGTKVRYLG